MLSVLFWHGPGEATSAAEISAAVMDAYGISVSDAYVRVVKSRDDREAKSHSASSSTVPALSRPDALVVPLRHTLPVRNTERHASGNDEQIMQLIDRCVNAIEKALTGASQKVTGSPEFIAEIAAILDDNEIRQNYPGYAYDIYRDGEYKTLRLYNAELPPNDPESASGTVTIPVDPRDIVTVQPARRTGKNRERECDFCEGKRQHVLGIDLYQVHGGPIGPKTHVLCGLHAQGLAAAGSDVRPYRVRLTPGYGVIEPEPIPYRKMLANLAKSVTDIFLTASTDATV